MFNAKVTFTLSITKSSGTRFLSSSVIGEGIQDGITQGSYSEKSYLSDFLAKFYCEAYDVEEGYSKIQIFKLYSTQRNGKINPIEIPIPYTLDGIDISKYIDDNIEGIYGINNILYIFIQKADSNRRRLSDSSICSISGNEGTLNIEGTVIREESINDRNFTIKTSDDKDAECILHKDDSTYDANLECIVNNPGKDFYLNEENYIATDQKGDDYILFIPNDNNSSFCQVSDDSYGSSSSSSGGLSGGAIAGIVIGSIVIIVIIGTILFFVYKKTALFGGVNAGTSAYTEPGASSISNMNISKLKK